VPVPSLTLPAETDPPTPDLLREFEAVRLFVDRAVSVSPSFAFDVNTAPHILHICRRLDGLPLAIELAAAQIYHLSVQTLHDRLTHRLPLLTGGPRDLPDRQRTLRETIAWSYELLAPGEQTLFRQLSVFAGGFTLETAESVSEDGNAVLGHLAALVDKSLVPYRPGAVPGARYALLETIHEYAAEQLQASGSETATRERHAACFLQLARQAEPELTQGAGRVWAERLEAEHDNLRQALDFLAESQRWSECLQLASDLGDFWDIRGHLSEGRAWLERALTETDGNDVAGATRALRALAATRLALILLRQGSLDEAESHLDAAQQVWRVEENAARLALTFCLLGGVAEYRGDDRRAQLLYERGLKLFRTVGDPAGMAMGLNNLADTAYRLGDLSRAATLAQEAIAIAYAGGLDVMRASALFTIAEIAFANGRYQDALAALRDGMETSRMAGYRLGLADAFIGFAAVAAATGDGERAARLLGAVETMTQELGIWRIPHQTFRGSALAATQAVLDEETFASAWAQGQELSLAEAVAATEAVQVLPPVAVLSQLTPRERDVLRLLVAGKTDRAIGEQLFIGTRTVESHVANIFAKLGVRSRSAVVAVVATPRIGETTLPPSTSLPDN
ncbi:MAG: tetratricopeptide repeat protein, partial [Thermomicrobiales bacterium]|nr:tetratricopeptide repeat protein [Thermomicrobiales bacterium]